MLKNLVRCAAIALILLPFAAVGDPIKLKLAYYGSDQTRTYIFVIKPFVDAVNGDEQGGIIIETYPGGALGKDPGQQAQLVRTGVADIAYVVLGPVADQFGDHAVIELPGLFRDMREATLVDTRLFASRILQGYDDFFVVGAFATEPETIHTRVPDCITRRLKRQKDSREQPDRSIGARKARHVFGRFADRKNPRSDQPRHRSTGRRPALGPLTDFGLGRVVTYHYFLRLGPAVLSILMNRKEVREPAPRPARTSIRKYSGEWLAERFVKGYELYNADLLEQLKSEPLRKVMFPSQSEIDTAAEAFRAVRAEWAGASPHHRQLLNAVEAEILKFRSGH